MVVLGHRHASSTEHAGRGHVVWIGGTALLYFPKLFSRGPSPYRKLFFIPILCANIWILLAYGFMSRNGLHGSNLYVVINPRESESTLSSLPRHVMSTSRFGHHADIPVTNFISRADVTGQATGHGRKLAASALTLTISWVMFTNPKVVLPALTSSQVFSVCSSSTSVFVLVASLVSDWKVLRWVRWFQTTTTAPLRVLGPSALFMIPQMPPWPGGSSELNAVP
ncbi:uncharacterized protein LACBIDRAFT_323073 [Laccaria bicolor S238N-H82]|uniref:Predicted protein n=1 Tax=Laccaria bicolor (strain S238N-H82 / ATCC MYA-4686) TaxID=486041 RepID=B0CW13_LACBS|nr:uncharacterized protein LACBIDRAFT_323073 [Laccaria bicolor S238N-H82]EDR13837.1 predicted protein [Laccaria bicolor S238N-H82]|eukprot:XP_001876335.1 predicted protein [Laccaria bicolor S238N-H82]